MCKFISELHTPFFCHGMVNLFQEEREGKITMARRKRDPQKESLVKAILNEYQPEGVEDMQDALKDIFGPMFEAMLQGEMKAHLGYESNDRQEKDETNRRNGYSK